MLLFHMDTKHTNHVNTIEDDSKIAYREIWCLEEKIESLEKKIMFDSEYFEGMEDIESV
jgi:hypothetical protein